MLCEEHPSSHKILLQIPLRPPKTSAVGQTLILHTALFIIQTVSISCFFLGINVSLMQNLADHETAGEFYKKTFSFFLKDQFRNIWIHLKMPGNRDALNFKRTVHLKYTLEQQESMLRVDVGSPHARESCGAEVTDFPVYTYGWDPCTHRHLWSA